MNGRPSRPPGESPLERLQRRLERWGSRRGRAGPDVEQQQPVMSWRDRVAVGDSWQASPPTRSFRAGQPRWLQAEQRAPAFLCGRGIGQRRYGSGAPHGGSALPSAAAQKASPGQRRQGAREMWTRQDLLVDDGTNARGVGDDRRACHPPGQGASCSRMRARKRTAPVDPECRGCRGRDRPCHRAGRAADRGRETDEWVREPSRLSYFFTVKMMFIDSGWIVH